MAKAPWRKLPACASSRSWDGQLQRYLGLIHGQPVAMSALFLAAGVAGIYEVLTLPHLRGQGVGGAMTRYPLQVARQVGYRIGVLEASPLGLQLYHHLGFHEHCQYLLFGWELALVGRADACSTYRHVRDEMRKPARYVLVCGITLGYMQWRTTRHEFRGGPTGNRILIIGVEDPIGAVHCCTSAVRMCR